jgi:ssRNA-specific RNase YbeY (16S rRNA maturation enzyme)
MILHGLVHLKGFDHELSDASWRVMSSLEKALSKEVVRAMGQPRYVTFVMS